MFSSSCQPFEYRLSLRRFQSHARVADAVVSCSTEKIPTIVRTVCLGRGTIVHPDPEPHVLRVLSYILTSWLFLLFPIAELLPHGIIHILHGKPRFIHPLGLEQIDPVGDLLPWMSLNSPRRSGACRTVQTHRDGHAAGASMLRMETPRWRVATGQPPPGRSRH